MFPTLFELDLAGRTFALDSHGLFIMLGAIAGVLLTLRLGQRVGLPRGPLRELALELLLVGAIGARMFFVAFHATASLGQCREADGWLETLASCTRPLWRWEDGFSFYGGLISALLWLGVRAPHFVATSSATQLPSSSVARVLSLADLFTPGLGLSHVFAKVGCLFAGCCFGAPTSSGFGLRFPDDSAAFQALLDAGRLPAYADRTPPLQPVQLYEASANLVLCLILVVLFRRARHRPGLCLGVYLVAQALLRLAAAF